MADGRESCLEGITKVIERFTKDAALVPRLLVESETFQSICEDDTLARAILDRLEGSQRIQQDAKAIVDYLALVAELEWEITEALRNAK